MLELRDHGGAVCIRLDDLSEPLHLRSDRLGAHGRGRGQARPDLLLHRARREMEADVREQREWDRARQYEDDDEPGNRESSTGQGVPPSKSSTVEASSRGLEGFGRK